MGGILGIDSFFHMVIFASAIAGVSTSLLGVFIVGMRVPFIGTCISHAAMAGVIGAALLNIHPLAGAITLSVLTSTSLSMLDPAKSRLDANVALAVVFSLMLGLTFLAMGLVQDSRTEILGLLWGSILFVKKDSVIIISIMAAVLILFTALFNKELKMLLFSRSLAAATGVHQGLVYTLFLALCGIILSVNLQLIGGLMIFALMTNPAAAAYQICRGHRAVVIVSSAFGMLSAVSGFLFSYYLNLPTGACIVIASVIIFAICAAAGKFTQNQ